MNRADIAELKPLASWSPDCQGKWDYDGKLISISCRYWPAGGGVDLLDTATDTWTRGVEGVRPSAVASILMWHGGNDYITLAKHEFEGDSEADVKQAVETWVSAQFRIVAKTVADAFPGVR